MRLRELTHEGFRNLAPGRVTLAPGTTVLIGDNGQGKTSFLEAIGVLATSRSFRRARAAEMVQADRSSFLLRGQVEQPTGTVETLAIEHADGKRTALIGRVSVELSEYISRLTVIPITQSHAGVVRGGPQERRDFLDRGVLGVRPAYLQSIATYRRTLRHVNALLRDADGRGAGRDQLEAWFERLAGAGAEIVTARRWYVRRLVGALADVGPTFSPTEEQLTLRLHDVLGRSELDAEPSVEEVVVTLSERLLSQLDRAVQVRQVLVGPHRDDLEIELGGRDARRFASSGQQRNALLALKMAKVEVFRDGRGETPVLLVDDVDTEIDAGRLGTFLEHVGGRAQAVLTSSKPELFDDPGPESVHLRVARGVISEA